MSGPHCSYSRSRFARSTLPEQKRGLLVVSEPKAEADNTYLDLDLQKLTLTIALLFCFEDLTKNAGRIDIVTGNHALCVQPID